jgi:hypothetical protein
MVSSKPMPNHKLMFYVLASVKPPAVKRTGVVKVSLNVAAYWAGTLLALYS